MLPGRHGAEACPLRRYNMRSTLRLYVGALAALGLSAAPSLAYAKGRQIVLPHCERSLGTAAVRLPPEAQDWWSGQHLSSPDTAVKALVQESGCFRLVDRGAAMQLADEERARAASGQLRRGSHIGRGQVRAADYIIVPTLLSSNGHAGGVNVGGILGTVGSFFGVGGVVASAVAGGLNISKKEAAVHLEVVSVRSSEVVAMADGHASKHDVGFGGGTGFIGSGSLGAFGASSYSDTAMGKVIMNAYADAYAQLVQKLGGVPAETSVVAENPVSPQAVQGSVTTIRVSELRSLPSLTGRKLHMIPVGTVLYPTGERSGVWLKVADEVGTEGWVSSLSVSSR